MADFVKFKVEGLYVDNPRYTSWDVAASRSVKESVFNGRRYLWPANDCKVVRKPTNAGEIEFYVEPNCLVVISYATGSRKYIYWRRKWILLSKTGAEVTLDISRWDSEEKATLKDFELIAEFRDRELRDLEEWLAEWRVRLEREGLGVSRAPLKALENVIGYIIKQRLSQAEAEHNVDTELVEIYTRLLASADSQLLERLAEKTKTTREFEAAKKTASERVETAG